MSRIRDLEREGLKKRSLQGTNISSDECYVKLTDKWRKVTYCWS